MRGLAASAGILLLALTTPAAAVTPPTVRLLYQRADNAADCPDREAVLDAVRARLGFDPFREPAEITIRAAVARAGDELSAQIRLSDETTQTGERRLVSDRADCAELASSMELALSIAIDPLSSARAPVSPPAVVVPTTTPVIVAVQRAPVPPASPKYVDVVAGTVGNLGETVGPTMGGFASVGLRGERWSLSLEGRADLPRSRSAGGGSISAGTLAATLSPCVRQGPFGACALVTLEALRGSGQNLSNAHQLTSPFGAVGARALVEFPSRGALAFRVQADVVSPLTRTTLKVGTDAVWTSPPVTVALGLAAVVKFR